MKKINYWIILILIVYGWIEICSYSSLFLLSKYCHNYRRVNLNYAPVDVISTKHINIINNIIKQRTDYVVFSPSLGWSIKKNGASRLYQASSSGIRAVQEYAFTPSPGIRRISAFGDSFTHCDGVAHNLTWQTIMESYASHLQVINFGVSGFGLDQAYLRYLEDGVQYKSHFVLIGFMSENIYRNVNMYRPFYFYRTRVPFTKPRFIIKNKKLTLVPNQMQSLSDYEKLLLHPKEILSRLGLNDYYYKRGYESNLLYWLPMIRLGHTLIQKFSDKLTNETIVINGQYNKNSEAFQVTTKIFDQFYHAVIKNKSIPIILIFPSKTDIISYHKQKKKQYAKLLLYFDLMGYKYIDLMDAFKHIHVENLFASHYSPPVNALVARYILNHSSF